MPKRIQLSRQKGWRKPEGAVVVARPTMWGNPFSVKQFGRPLAVQLYDNAVRGLWNPSPLRGLSDEEYYAVAFARDAWFKRFGGHPADIARTVLAGHDLACWCPLDAHCHADVLLDIANADHRSAIIDDGRRVAARWAPALAALAEL